MVSQTRTLTATWPACSVAGERSDRRRTVPARLVDLTRTPGTRFSSGCATSTTGVRGAWLVRRRLLSQPTATRCGPTTWRTGDGWTRSGAVTNTTGNGWVQTSAPSTTTVLPRRVAYFDGYDNGLRTPYTTNWLTRRRVESQPEPVQSPRVLIGHRDQAHSINDLSNNRSTHRVSLQGQCAAGRLALQPGPAARSGRRGDPSC